MAMTAIYPITEKFIDKCDPEDPEYQKDLIRPVEIKEDVKLMEQRKRVSIILKSKIFRKELEDVVRKQCHTLGFTNSSASLMSINNISEQLLLASIPRKTTSSMGVGASSYGIIPINDLRDGLAKIYGQNEHQIRCKIAAVHRLMDMFTWCNGYTHYITARISTGGDEFIIKPFGLFFHEVTASCLITIDSKGNTINPGSTVLTADSARWPFQSAIHAARPDISCLIFLRTSAALCVSGSMNGFLPISADSIMLGDVGSFVPNNETIDIDCHSSMNKLQTDILKVFDRNKKVLFVPNHGIFIGGSTIEEAWFLVQRVQAACEVQELLYKLDESELFLPEKEVVDNLKNVWQQFSEVSVADEKCQGQQQLYFQKYRAGYMEFEAMMRHLDNSGYRTGYLYQTVNVFKSGTGEDGDKHVSKYPDVEIPPSSSSSAHRLIKSVDENVHEFRSFRQESNSTSWFNTPNTYKLDNTLVRDPSIPEDSFLSMPSSPEYGKRRWVSINPQYVHSCVTPHHPVTPGAHLSIKRPAFISVPLTPPKSPLKGIDPKELKAKQKKVKDKYYFDTNTAGPQSTLLDGLTWEEARRVRDEGLTKYLGSIPNHGGEPLITAASKGIIQRDHKHHAVVLENVFKPSNPFDKVTDDDLTKYREEVERKMHPELYMAEEVVVEPEIIIPIKTEVDYSLPELPSIPYDTSIRQEPFITEIPSISITSNNATDLGMTSDSDYPGESSLTRPSAKITAHGTITSETSAADYSHDDTEKEGKHGKEKKKRSLKSFFSSKKKKKDDKK